MKALSRLVAAGAMAASLAGCVGFNNTFAVSPFLDRKIEGSDFNMCLAAAYQRRTQVEAKVDTDYVHAGRFAAKGEAALAGQDVQPWSAADWNVAPDDVAALDSARADLVSTIAANRDARPCECAQAQVAYDGWLEQSHDNDLGPGFIGPVQKDFVAAERAAYLKLSRDCAGGTPVAMTAATSYIVFFDFNKSSLTAEAARIVAEAATAAKEKGEVRLLVVGHTDTVGSASYNQALSERRADAVRDALVSEGIDGGDIAIEGRGFSEPLVATGPGVREPQNRRAVIDVQ
jgi:outer membrane protein OmpA-like peptidoglycan-associated protein